MAEIRSAEQSSAELPLQTYVAEQRLFELSPLPAFPTAAAVFILLVASFELGALVAHYPLKDQLSFSPREGAWPAIILSLLIAVALGMQRYSRTKDLEDAAELDKIIPYHQLHFLENNAADMARLRRASAVGAVIGLFASFFVVPRHVMFAHVPVFLWFAAVMSVLGAMIVRGAVMTRIAARDFSDRIDRVLTIDLLRIDELSVIGRASARVSLIWLSVAAVICLFFVGGEIPAVAIVTMVFAAGMGVWIFFRSLERVHRKIRSAKQAELDRVRREIAACREEAVRDHGAAARLHGLIAYETRIAGVHEWPFDQLTLLRVGAYVLIPAAPAAGQFALKFFMEHFAK